ncbi:uncharacterized protein LOC124805550 [Schistocerca piceifrons]|uniref:uncharacterized protein LOC124805550 n=1 Tax=Schistocerca piceifrons TaxID=274613 RepID=UPI001F5FD0EC|nr:uncharacterized protein LOC124805550 [Schistocerca piceifrons]
MNKLRAVAPRLSVQCKHALPLLLRVCAAARGARGPHPAPRPLTSRAGTPNRGPPRRTALRHWPAAAERAPPAHHLISASRRRSTAGSSSSSGTAGERSRAPPSAEWPLRRQRRDASASGAQSPPPIRCAAPRCPAPILPPYRYRAYNPQPVVGVPHHHAPPCVMGGAGPGAQRPQPPPAVFPAMNLQGDGWATALEAAGVGVRSIDGARVVAAAGPIWLQAAGAEASGGGGGGEGRARPTNGGNGSGGLRC